jgi:hypothetical protein
VNCSEFEPLIALHAGGDLERAESALVEAHVASCAGCRELLDDLRSDRATFEEWGSAPADAALLVTVRSGVMARVRKRRVVLWPWAAAAAIAAASLALSLRMRVEPIRPVMQAPVVVAQQPAAAKPAVRRKRQILPRRDTPDAEPLVVKMLTDDPDIVIVWLVDQTGD